MHEKNYEYLRKQVNYTGYEGLDDKLKENLEKQLPKFALTHQKMFDKDTVDSVLNFTKSNKTDLTFFNTVQMKLQKEKSKDIIEQTFYIKEKGDQNITLQEAYNLMSGRSVYKELTNKGEQIYNAWIQINFDQVNSKGSFKYHQYNDNYGFNLKNALEKHSIKFETLQDKLDLLNSLKKGDRVLVPYIVADKVEQRYIEANPQFKIINVYDINLQRLASKKIHGEKNVVEGNSQKETAKKETQSQNDDDAPNIPESKKKNAKKQRNSIH